MRGVLGGLIAVLLSACSSTSTNPGNTGGTSPVDGGGSAGSGGASTDGGGTGGQSDAGNDGTSAPANQALLFVDGSCAASSTSALAFITLPFTIAFWIRVDGDTAPYQSVVYHGGSGPGFPPGWSVELALESDGYAVTLCLRSSANAGATCPKSTARLEKGERYHVAVQWNPSQNVKYFVAPWGQAHTVETVALAETFDAIDPKLQLGGCAPHAPFQGALDEVRIWKGATKSVTELNAIKDVTDCADPDLTAYYHLDDADLSATDCTGKAPSLGLSGDVLWIPTPFYP